MRFQFSPFFSIFSFFISILLLFYFWIPMLIIFVILGLGFIGYSLIVSLFTGRSPANVQIIKIRRYSTPEDPKEEEIDYIDSTTSDKENKQ